MIITNRDRRYTATQSAHLDWCRAAGRRAVAQLAVAVPAPTCDAACRGEGTGVSPTCDYLGDVTEWR